MDAGRTFARLLNNIDQDGAGPRVSRLVSRYYCNSLKPTCTGKKTPGGAGIRLRVWIRRALRRFARLPLLDLLVINPDGQIFGLAIPRSYRHPAGDSTLIVQI